MIRTRRRVTRGDRFRVAVEDLTEPDGSVSDVTGHTLRFTAKDREDDLDAAAVISATQVVADGSGGSAELYVPAAATGSFPTTRALYYDVQLSDPAGNAKTFERGILIVEADVSRAAP